MRESPELPPPLKYSEPAAADPRRTQPRSKKNGKPTWEMPIYPYPTRTGWNPITSTFQPVEGKRGGVDRITEQFLPTRVE